MNNLFLKLLQQLFQKTPTANDYGDAGSGYGGGYDDEDDSEYDDEVEGSGFRSGHTPTQHKDVLLVVKYLDDSAYGASEIKGQVWRQLVPGLNSRKP